MSDKTLKEATKTVTEKGLFQPKTEMAKEMAKKAAKATKIGKVAAVVGLAGAGLSKYLKSKMDKKDKDLEIKGDAMRPVDKKSMGGEIEITKGKDYIKDLL